MDFNSPEFYTIAFVVAMALIALLMGKREKRPPSTYIVQLTTTPASAEEDDVVTIEAVDGGRIRITRTGIMVVPEDTVNLVITIQEDNCTIIEKRGAKRTQRRASSDTAETQSSSTDQAEKNKGVKHRKAVPEPASGEALIKGLRPTKYKVRYESQLTSAWATFTLDAASPQPTQVTLRY